MTAENTARQPKGITVGGQFATTAHAEPELSLAAPTPKLSVDVLADRYLAAKDQHEAYAQNAWVEQARTKHPDAAFAAVRISKEGMGYSTAGMELFHADGSDIDLTEDDSVYLEDRYDTHWQMGAHEADESDGIFVAGSGVFSLDSVKNRWAEIQSSPEPSNDPFAHLTGMDRARAQSAYAQQINTEATAAYVEDLSSKLLAINPEFSRLYVKRNAEVESGLTFTLSHVEDTHSNIGDVDLSQLENHGFQDIHLDSHVDHREDTDELYINIDPGN